MYELKYLVGGRWHTVAVADDYDRLLAHQARMFGKTAIMKARR